MCTGYSPLDTGCEWFCGDQREAALNVEQGPPLCSVVVIALFGAGSVVGLEAKRSISELQCKVHMTGALLLGEEPLNIPPQELFGGMLCGVTCHSCKVDCCWHCPQPCLGLGRQTVSSGVLQPLHL